MSNCCLCLNTSPCGHDRCGWGQTWKDSSPKPINNDEAEGMTNWLGEEIDLDILKFRLKKSWVDPGITEESMGVVLESLAYHAETLMDWMSSHKELQSKLAKYEAAIKQITEHEPENIVCAEYSFIKDIARSAIEEGGVG